MKANAGSYTWRVAGTIDISQIQLTQENFTGLQSCGFSVRGLAKNLASQPPNL